MTTPPTRAEAGAPPGSDAGVLAFAVALLACALVLSLVGLVAPSVPLSPLLAFAIAYLAVSAEIVTLAALSPSLPSRWAAIASVVCLAGLFGFARAPATWGYAAGLTVVLGAGACLLGAAVGARIEKPGQLAAVALVSSLADLWSVFDPSAPSARFAEQVLAHPDRLALFALPFPLLGSALVPAVIGAGDVLFAALYIAAFRAHGLPVRRVTSALAVAFVVGLVALVWTLRPIPLLPLLGVAVLASDPAARSLTGREWRTVLWVCAAMMSAVALRMSR